jgi:hypothetical protein
MNGTFNAITNGTSNVTASASANITVGVAGTPNVVVWATTGQYVTGIVSATGNVIGGNITTAGLISATGNVSGGNLNVTGNIVDTGALTIITGSNGNIALTPNGTGIVTVSSNVSITGNVIGGNLSVGTGTITVGNIVNSNANAVGNIGSASNYFNTVFAKSTSAQYADLAETYIADAGYAPGTLVIFGGADEITASTVSHDTRVAGIISTAPAYLMNSGAVGLPVALTGRVPCSVVGTIRKGDRLVASDIKGVATALDITKYLPGCIIGKALENYDLDSTGVIEVAVGRY